MSIRTQELSKVQKVNKLSSAASFIIEYNDEIKRLDAKDIIGSISSTILGDNKDLQTVSGVVGKVEACIKNDAIHYLSIPLSGWRDANNNQNITEISPMPCTQTVNAEWCTENSFPELYANITDDLSITQYKAYSKMFSILTTGSATTANGSITFKIYKKPISDINIILKGG